MLFQFAIIPSFTIGFNCVNWLLYNSQIDSSPHTNVYVDALLKNEFEWQLKSTTQSVSSLHKVRTVLQSFQKQL